MQVSATDADHRDPPGTQPANSSKYHQPKPSLPCFPDLHQPRSCDPRTHPLPPTLSTYTSSNPSPMSLLTVLSSPPPPGLKPEPLPSTDNSVVRADQLCCGHVAAKGCHACGHACCQRDGGSRSRKGHRQLSPLEGPFLGEPLFGASLFEMLSKDGSSEELSEWMLTWLASEAVGRQHAVDKKWRAGLGADAKAA